MRSALRRLLRDRAARIAIGVLAILIVGALVGVIVLSQGAGP
jgi:hypothetical protein